MGDTLKNQAGESFFHHTWRSPKGPPSLLLIIHHGIGEHLGRYEALIQPLLDLPIMVAGYDARGHGRSSGKRGHARGITQLIEDFAELLPLMIDESGVDNVVIMGHSLGGAVVAGYICLKEFDPRVKAVMLSAPALGLNLSWYQKVKVQVGKLLKHAVPDLTATTQLDVHGLSSEPEVIEAYQHDPLVHCQTSIALGTSFGGNGSLCLQRAHEVRIPVLIYQGNEDQLINLDTTRTFFEKLGSSTKKLLILEGARHEPHHASPKARAQLMTIVREWLQSFFPRP
jgi:alpha-beta hydrolase superfamily lysophospholipase